MNTPIDICIQAFLRIDIDMYSDSDIKLQNPQLVQPENFLFFSLRKQLDLNWSQPLKLHQPYPSHEIDKGICFLFGVFFFTDKTWQIVTQWFTTIWWWIFRNMLGIFFGKTTSKKSQIYRSILWRLFFHDFRMRLFAAASISTLVSRLFVGADHGLPWGLLGGAKKQRRDSRGRKTGGWYYGVWVVFVVFEIGVWPIASNSK